MTPDPRINVIAKAFCIGHRARDEWTPCPLCVSRARDAVDAIDATPTLFDKPPADAPLPDPAQNGPGVAAKGATDTSEAARWAIYPKIGSQRMAVLKACVDAYEQDGGLTDEELADLTGLSPSSVRPRRGELVAGGWLYDSGTGRRTRSGQLAIVWALTPKGWIAWWRKESVYQAVGA